MCKMNTASLSYFLISSMLLTLAPGPDILYLLTKSLADGAKSGIALASGLVSGIFLHTVLVILGAAALIQGSPFALAALKYSGASYLLYLSWKAFHDTGEIHLGTAGSAEKPFALWKRGILMNVLNPKVLLFFLAFLPQFISAEGGKIEMQIALLGFLFAAQAFLIFSVVAFCAEWFRRFLLKTKGIGRILAAAQGVVLLIIALLLLF